MKFQYLLLGFFLLGISMKGIAQDLPTGVWKVVLPPDDISAYYQNKKDLPYKGKKINIQLDHYSLFYTNKGKNPFEMGKIECTAPDYLYEEELDYQFYQRQEISVDSVWKGAPKALGYWSIACTDFEVNPAVTLYQINSEYLLLAYQGLFCYLKKVKERPGFWPFRWLVD